MIERVTDAIKVMQEKNIPINFQSVAKYSAASKTCLYREAKIKAKINSLRSKDGVIKRTTNLHTKIQKKDIKITTLINKIKILEKKILDMKNQLEVAYGEIYRLNSGEK